MNDYQASKKRALEDANRYLNQHVIKDGLVRSFRFHGFNTDRELSEPICSTFPFGKVEPLVEKTRYQSTGAYAFTVTWTPGQMVLTGDIGELTLTHYHAMADFEAAIQWAQSSDFDYLLGKSDRKKVYDPDATLRAWKHYAYEAIISDTWGYATNWWDKQAAGSVRKWHWGTIQDLRAWRKDKPKWDKRGGQKKADFQSELRLWKEDKPKLWYIEAKARALTGYREYNRHDDVGDWWDFSEGWGPLIRLWRHVFDGCDPRYGWDDPAQLLTGQGRWKLWDEVERHMDNEHEAYEIAYALSDDPCDVCHEWQAQDMFKIAAIQHGCRMITERLGLRERAAA